MNGFLFLGNYLVESQVGGGQLLHLLLHRPTTVAGVLFVRILCFVVVDSYVFSFMFVFVFDSGFGFVAIVLFLSFIGEIW